MSFYREVNVDASYYLGTTEFIFQGFVPLLDFKLTYSPFCFYFLLPFRFLMKSGPDYTFYLLIFYSFIIASSFVLYKILIQITNKKILSRLLQLLFLIQIFLLEGTYIVLEPIVVFAGLLSFLLLYSNKNNNHWVYFISGIFSGMAFMSKQYGLAFLAGNLLYLIFSEGNFKTKIYRILIHCAGFSILPLVFIFYLYANNVTAKQMFSSFIGNSYGERNFSQWMNGTKRLFDIRYFPTLCLVFLYFVPLRKSKMLPLVISLIITAILLTFQFYFQVFDHYYILIVPIILMLYSFLSKIKPSKLSILFVLIILIQTIYLGKKVVFRTIAMSKNNYRNEQFERIKYLNPYVQNKETIYCIGSKSIPYYFLLNKRPSMYEKYGYEFGFESENQMTERAKNADIILIDSQIAEELMKSNSPLGKLLHSYKITTKCTGIILFEKNVLS